MQEWKEKIRIVRGRLAWASLPLCFCGLVLFDVALRFFYRAAGSTRFLDWRAFVFTGAWSLLLTGAAALLPPLGRRIAMGVYAVFFGLLSVVHGVMFNIFGEFFTFSDTNFAGDGAKFFSLSYLNLRKALVASIVLAMLLLAVGAWLVPQAPTGETPVAPAGWSIRGHPFVPGQRGAAQPLAAAPSGHHDLGQLVRPQLRGAGLQGFYRFQPLPAAGRPVPVHRPGLCGVPLAWRPAPWI